MAHSPNMAYFFHINFISFFQVFSLPFYFLVLPLHNILKLGKTSLHTCGHKVYLSYSFLSHEIQPAVEFLTYP